MSTPSKKQTDINVQANLALQGQDQQTVQQASLSEQEQKAKQQKKIFSISLQQAFQSAIASGKLPLISDKQKVETEIQNAYENFIKQNFPINLVEETEETKTWIGIAEKDYVSKIAEVKQKVEDTLQELKSSIAALEDKNMQPGEKAAAEISFLENLILYHQLRYILIFDKNLQVIKKGDEPLSQQATPANSIFSNNQVFKIRIESQNSKKRFDVNVRYNIQIADGVRLLKNSNITKEFEILKTEKRRVQGISK